MMRALLLERAYTTRALLLLLYLVDDESLRSLVARGVNEGPVGHGRVPVVRDTAVHLRARVFVLFLS